MPTMNEVFRVHNLDSGMVTSISPMLLEQGSGYSRVFKNLDATLPGLPRKRPACVPLIATPGQADGIHQFIKLSSGQEFLLLAYNGTVLRWDGASWIQVASGLNPGPTDFLTIADQVVFANEVDDLRRWTGTGGVSTVSGIQGRFLTEHRLRVMIAQKSQIRLSHTGDPTLWDPDASGSNAVMAYVSPDDGDIITGLISLGDGGVLIGKRNSIYGLFGYKRENFVIDKLDPSVGVASHRSLAYARPYAYFVWDQGIYRMQPGGTPERISYPIEELFNSLVDKDNIEDSAGLLYNRNYVVSIPAVGGDTVTFCYHIDRERWGIWDNPANVIDSTQIPGDFEGKIYYLTKDINSIVRITEAAETDFPSVTGLESAISAEVTTLELDAGRIEVEKDFCDLYVILRLPLGVTSSKATVAVYLDGASQPSVSCNNVTLKGTGGNRVLLRVPIGKTARFMEVTLKNDQSEQFTPVSLYYTYQFKEVL